MPASIWSALNQHREKHWLCTCFYYDTFLMFFLSFQSASCKWFKMWAPPSLSSTIALLRPRGSLTVGHTHRASGGLCWWASSLAVGSKEGLNENRDWNQMGLSQKLCSTTWTDVTSLSQCCSFYTFICPLCTNLCGGLRDSVVNTTLFFTWRSSQSNKEGRCVQRLLQSTMPVVAVLTGQIWCSLGRKWLHRRVHRHRKAL